MAAEALRSAAGVRVDGAGDVGRALELVRERAAGRQNTAALRQPVSTAAAAEQTLRPDPALPVAEEFAGLLPWRGLRRGAVVSVTGSAMLLLALIGQASAQGSWCAAVGYPSLGMAAAAEAGVALDRFALVPHPGERWADVAAALIDGFDVVILAPPTPPGYRLAAGLAARARQRGTVLLPTLASWPGADLTVSVDGRRWQGLGTGYGRLRYVDLDVSSGGRGAAGRPRQTTVRLPLGAGPLLPEPDTEQSRRHLRAV